MSAIAILCTLYCGWQLNNNIRAMRESQQNIKRLDVELDRETLEQLWRR
ncbi:hypothetical protein AVDCRST_MAG94-4303 [uncultured Leptolyngbya sp.]|uniref:Uncharacterized protein n=1 Tax=uncultured Leptolyngbya sp. TaxID=332963 RepID=A0A6J4MYZ3_9CYAN|nr:hypothetical protein AVDCRST_MAG94-4303 [uncultured Leptolyngbya sp.]